MSDGRGFRKDVIAALRELKVSIVRWPGGCFASGYHWYEGVGADRPEVYDKAWRVEEPNTFGTDEFVMWCRAIGAEPYICTNAGSALPEESSDWVDYVCETGTFTHDKVGIPALDAVVTCIEGRKKFVMALINRHPTDELSCEVLISDKGRDCSLPATVFSADSVDAFNDVDRPNRAVPQRDDLRCNKGRIMLPGHSVTICEMTAT